MDNNKKLKCPVPDTHNRLNQAFSLFQNILEDYQNPLRFTSVLNNLIQNLRNVTFILQKELAHVNNFSDWYLIKQKEMREDDTLKWLHNARTHVVHIGDLKKKSVAKVRLKNHYDQDLFTMELDPNLSTEAIAKDFCNIVPLKIQKNLLEQTVIEVERIWMVDEYPKAEIIDILIYCLSTLVDLVYRAHEELLNTNALLCEHNLYINPLENFMVVLHNKIKKGRITCINYKTGDIYGHIADVGFNIDNNIMTKAKEKYTNSEQLSSLIDKTNKDIPFNNTKYHLEMAKYLFEADGFHAPMAFLYFPNRPPTQIALTLEDPATKYLMFEKLAEKVEETGCKAIVIVSEIWGGNLPGKNEEYTPPHIQKKKEFIWLTVANPDKKEEYLIEILRDKSGNPILKKEQKVDGIVDYSLNRIYKNWEVNKKKDI